MKRITIAIDSFKGSLSSSEVADACEAGVREHLPHCRVQKVIIADGGEGTVEALTETLRGDYIEVLVADPLGRPTVARYGVIDGGTTAVMEMAAASGLTLLTAEERNPLLTSTFGTGQMIADALDRGCRKFLIGIGGSATNDGGTGMLRALGFRFLDAAERELTGGGEILEQIAHIDATNARKELSECEFIVACDVTNPLYGPTGAAYVFAPQKGADEAMVEQLDRGLRTYARAIERHNGVAIDEVAGAGAAGGLGGGFKALLGARLERGIDMILSAMHFDQIIEGSDLIITGEGRIDHQTMMGKAPSGVLRAASKQGIPTVAIGGAVELCEELERSDFAAIVPITEEPLPLEVAMQPDLARANVRRTTAQIVERFLLRNR